MLCSAIASRAPNTFGLATPAWSAIICDVNVVRKNRGSGPLLPWTYMLGNADGGC